MTLLTAETFRRVHPGQQRLRLGRPGQNCHRNLFCCMSLHSGGTAYPNHRTLPWLRAGHCRRRQRQLGALNDGNVRGGLAIIRAMAIKDVIALLDAEIATLKEARQLLKADSTGNAAPRKAGRPRKAENALPTAVTKAAKTKKKRNLSPEGRARIAEAAKRRWATQRKTAK